MKQIIRKVYKNKSNNQLLISIPVKSDIVEGDHVYITKVKISE